MRDLRSSGSRRGFSILEVAFASLILAMVVVPVWGLLRNSSQSVRRVDERKAARYLIREIMNRVESADFLVLLQYFGEAHGTPDLIANGLTTSGYSPATPPEQNPLKVPQKVLDSLNERGWNIELRFRFMTMDEVDPDNFVGAGAPTSTGGGLSGENVSSGSDLFKATSTGIQHLQGGFLKLTVSGPGLRTQSIKRPIYCPLILGRPGLLISQCPALNPALKTKLINAYSIP